MGDTDLTTAHGRLKWAREEKGYKSPRAAARAHTWNENTYKAHEAGRNKFDIDDAKRYGRSLRVNWVWLLTNVGEPKGKPSDYEVVSDDAEAALPGFAEGAPRYGVSTGLVAIREVDLTAGAGGGGEMPAAYRPLKDGSWVPTEAIRAEAHFPYAWLAAFGLDPESTDLVRIRGDSMSPEIEDGDWVFVDRRTHAMIRDDIYLLWDGFGVVAKSLAVIRASRPAKVRILSANPKYPPDEMPLDDIKIIGRVQFRIGRIVRGR